jgi:signal transduction histidine kinase
VIRPPIRLRLALAFTAAAAVLLTGAGVFAYARLAAGYSHDLDLELRQRAQDLIGPVGRGDTPLSELAGTGFIERGESFAEVVSPTGRVIESTPTLHEESLLSPAEAARASRGTITLDRPGAPGLDEPARLLATPFRRDGSTLVLVVGDTRENGLEVLRRVRRELLVGIPLLVLLTFGGAYAVAGAALRPVEAMRRRAAALTAADPALRLPVPAGDDEITRLGNTLNDLLARVEATLERERSFVAHASHELRTPLALLRTELELAVRRPRPAGDLAEAIRSAGDEVDRLQRLTEDLLLLAQVGEGRLEVQLARVPAAEALSQVRDRFESAAAAAGRSVELGPVEGEGRADPGLLGHALSNLVDNALEHGQGRIRLSSVIEGSAVTFAVTDEGRGFEPELLGRATDRFVRGPHSSGAGLGLAIVAAVAEAHGGSFRVANLPDRTEARLSVPSIPVLSSERESAGAGPRPGTPGRRARS